MDTWKRQVPIEDIIVPDAYPAPDSDRVEQIAESMASQGQLHDIGVTKRYRLVWGRHRLAAAVKNGMTSIQCLVCDGSDAELELCGIDENLMRQELTALRRAELVARRLELCRVLGKLPKTTTPPKEGRPETVDGKFYADTEKATGVSRRTLKRDAQVGEKLTEDAKRKLRGTKAENNRSALEKVAAAPPEKQVLVAEEVLGESKPQVEDERGTVVPAPLEDIFSDTFYSDSIAALRRIAKSIRARAGKPSGAYLRDDDATHACEQLIAALEGGKPYCVCKKCGGRGCPDCKSSGYWPQWAFDEYEAEDAA